jgi:hypothetical protein
MEPLSGNRNYNSAGSGGAIRAAANSMIFLFYSDFVDNMAPDGGAVYNLGDAEIEGSKFKFNEATVSISKFSRAYIVSPIHV